MIIISGPSSVGKNTLISSIISKTSSKFIVPVTSRNKREGEGDGRDYEFLSKTKFREEIRNQTIEDWDYTLGNYYGFRRNLSASSGALTVTHALARMALRIRLRIPDVVLIFLRPLDSNNHLERLHERFPDDEDRLARIAHWKEELEHECLFDHILSVRGGTEALGGNHVKLWRSLGLDI
jgi:guanylate kinase